MHEILLRTAQDTLTFDGDTARLISLRGNAAPELELIDSVPEHPTFLIQYLDEDGCYQQLASQLATAIEVEYVTDGVETRLTAVYHELGGWPLQVTFTVYACTNDRFSRWNITIDNQAGLRIIDVQFPFIVLAYDPGSAGSERAIVVPFSAGELLRNPAPQTLTPDSPYCWQFHPELGDSSHYPGGTFGQFLAYYNERAGVYLACEDIAANVKKLQPVHRDPGLRLGIAHVGDWPLMGARALEYDVVLTTFTGDWYAAAEIYRQWTQQQSWFTTLHQRTDVPAWLLESPPYITIRPQGVLDAGPIFPVEEFLPYEKCLPLLERIAAYVASPLVAVIMGWEGSGSWVYPDCFPPIGGDESVTTFARKARERGWHIGSFCNGTRWVLAHRWNGYDGAAYYREHHGERSVCRTPDGRPWEEGWDKSWRPSYTCCLGEANTRDIASHFIRRLLGWGLESIQFFDQNLGAATFPCFAGNHEHPPAPGKWMAEKMRQIMADFHRVAAELGETEVIHSTEQPANETCLPLYQECDCRVFPPGYGGNFIPLYHYLYHECIIIQGGMGNGPEPYHLPTRNAYNGVLGEIPGAVLTGDGTLLNKDTFNWALWEPKVGNNEHALEVMRTVTALRRGAGYDFLVYGRMLSPTQVDDISTITWQQGDRIWHIPAVFHATWQSPDGRVGVVLANWTEHSQRVQLSDERLGTEVTVYTSGPEFTTHSFATERVTITLPPHGCTLVTSHRVAQA